MSAFWEWGIAIFAMVMAFYVNVSVRVMRRQARRIADLTRRVWLLEGSPRGDV